MQERCHATLPDRTSETTRERETERQRGRKRRSLPGGEIGGGGWRRRRRMEEARGRVHVSPTATGVVT